VENVPVTAAVAERSEHYAVVERAEPRKPSRNEPCRRELRLGEVLSAMSFALDITEGQPCGHSARSCLVAMHIAEKLHLPAAERSALFYAVLLKDAGCSSNAAKMAYLFGADDRKIKHDLKSINWSKAIEGFRFMRQNVSPESSRLERFLKMAAMLLHGPGGAKKLVLTRCERGAEIADELGFPTATAQAIRDLDEHFDGQGQPRGLRGEEISLAGRIAGLAQTFEVFYSKLGLTTALEMTLARSGSWFDPQLVCVLHRLATEEEFRSELARRDADVAVAAYEPHEVPRFADDGLLDRVAEAFAHVVDAKSPWTFKHSRGVADLAVGMGRAVGFGPDRLRRLRRTALLHDVGKLGVSNLVLDKPGKLTVEEYTAVKKHPDFSERILLRVPAFADMAEIAGAHHERLDGQGYYRGICSDTLPLEARILMVADVFEALTAARPYRAGMPPEKVLEFLERDAGSSVCPTSLNLLKRHLSRKDFTSRVEHQLEALDLLAQDLAAPVCLAC
jgi:HD-GYP domain-containing protein (c-di-GMP phosphodiesterase class II)